ncbi:MAG: hypothetical protein LBB05_01720 [Puniceicoccales bacterium]|nr:hypothetical protein [Puniceicoccales bacterium]
MRSFIALIGVAIVLVGKVCPSGNASVSLNEDERVFCECCDKLKEWKNFTIAEWFAMADNDFGRYNLIIEEIKEKIKALKKVKKYRYSGCRISLKKLRDFLLITDIDAWIREEIDEMSRVLRIDGSAEGWAEAIQEINENKSEREDYDHFQEFIEFACKYNEEYPNAFGEEKYARFRRAVLDANVS